MKNSLALALQNLPSAPQMSISEVRSTHRQGLTLALLPLQTPSSKHKDWPNRALFALSLHKTLKQILGGSPELYL